MTRRSRVSLAACLALVIALWLVLRGGGHDQAAEARHDPNARTGIVPDLADALRRAKVRGPIAFPHESGTVTISGTVLDTATATPVGNVEIVVRSALGDESITAGADGTFHVEVARGEYRLFVRDDTVLTVGPRDRVRNDFTPRLDIAGLPDEALMPRVVANADVGHVELLVVRGAKIEGRVTDEQNRPISGAAVRARGGLLRPALGTDVTESDADGRFSLRVAEGRYLVEASEPRFTTSRGAVFHVNAGESVTSNVTLAAGCIVTGRVVDAEGKPAPDGAIEMQIEGGFNPSGRIEHGGAFHWSMPIEGEVALRAWPWKSPPSQPRTFTCQSGARFTDVVFQIPAREPTMSGVVVDANGDPVPLAYLDILPTTNAAGAFGQQERADEQGRWHIYDMVPGEYSVRVQAGSRGIAEQTVMSPSKDTRLVLSGTGRIEGTTSELAEGSFLAVLMSCGGVPLSHEPRLVTVTGGRFTIDDVPACDLTMLTRWRDRVLPVQVTVPAGAAAQIELGVGPRHRKSVSGVVSDADGRPIAGATVTATVEGTTPPVTAETDSTGRYEIHTVSGAHLSAQAGDNLANDEVGTANVDSEIVDFRLGTPGDL